MEKREYHVKLKFTTPVLGTSNTSSFYLQKNREEIEKLRRELEKHGIDAQVGDAEDGLEAIEEIGKKMTVFRRDEKGNPILLGYMIKGFLKTATATLDLFMKAKRGKKEPEPLSEYMVKKVIDLHFFPTYQIHFLDERGEIITDSLVKVFERPLRGMTAQGERVTIAISEMIEPPCFMEFDITCVMPEKVEKLLPQFSGNDPILKYLREAFLYGEYCGIGQFRSGQFGRFVIQELRKNEA